MPASLETLDTNIRQAFRNAWQSIVKATTGPVSTISVVPDATITGRADLIRSSGSWTDDGFDLGDEVTVAGDPNATNNGLAVVFYADAGTLSLWRPWMNPDPFVAETAGAAITVTAAMPAIQKLDGWKSSSATGRPWVREAYQPASRGSASLRAPTARTREKGLYWLTVFYPSNVGTAGAERLRGKVGAVIYPSAQLTANGQLVRVQLSTPKGPIEEEEWTGLPLTCSYWADQFNPA